MNPPRVNPGVVDSVLRKDDVREVGPSRGCIRGATRTEPIASGGDTRSG